jgi:hypothetical protein
MRFQIRYNDPRLQFQKVGSTETESIIGEEDLKRDIWLPHVFFVNEKCVLLFCDPLLIF